MFTDFVSEELKKSFFFFEEKNMLFMVMIKIHNVIITYINIFFFHFLFF